MDAHRIALEMVLLGQTHCLAAAIGEECRDIYFLLLVPLLAMIYTMYTPPSRGDIFCQDTASFPTVARRRNTLYRANLLSTGEMRYRSSDYDLPLPRSTREHHPTLLARHLT